MIINVNLNGIVGDSITTSILSNRIKYEYHLCFVRLATHTEMASSNVSVSDAGCARIKAKTFVQELFVDVSHRSAKEIPVGYETTVAAMSDL